MIYIIAAMTILAWAVILYMLSTEHDDLPTKTAPRNDFKHGQSGEDDKNVDWEPDDYSDLSDGKFERLNHIHTKVEDYERWDELDGREFLTDNQFQHIKKGR